ncbi:PRA1 family protein H [Nymphaea thermarum]|nr:PRA1 family protein H [Nymphaea thermarum]
MAFSANPLSLSVPPPAFESWLRESGYLETLDCRDAHPPMDQKDGFSFSSVLSLLTINPFSKVTADDLTRSAAPWTAEFFDSGTGPSQTYSLPSSSSQARLRVQENVKRYIRNYIYIYVLILGCAMYKNPLAVLGVLSTLALWDLFRLCSTRLRLDSFPSLQQVVIIIAQSATVVILMYCKVMIAFFWAAVLGYAVMILHSLLRKLTPLKQPLQEERRTKMSQSSHKY